MERKPFLQETLGKGLVNVFALAEHIQSDVEKELKQKVKTSAVMMALRRLSKKLEKRNFSDLNLVPVDFIIRSDVVELTIHNNNQEKIFPKIYALVNFRRGGFVTITQSMNETTIITKRSLKRDIQNIVKKDIIKTIDNLSMISVQMPDKYLKTYGVIYSITRELAWHAINIIEIVSTLNEISIVVKEEDVPNAYRVLKQLFSKK